MVLGASARVRRRRSATFRPFIWIAEQMDTAPPTAPNSADLGPGHPPALDRSVADSRTAPAVGTSDRRHAAQRHAAIDGAGCRHDGRDTLSVPRPRPAGHRGSRGAGAPSRTPSDARPRAWPSDTLTGGRVRRLARPAAPTTAAASPWPLAQTALERHRFRAAASGPWPPPHGGRTVRPQPVREAWSTGAKGGWSAVADAPSAPKPVNGRASDSDGGLGTGGFRSGWRPRAAASPVPADRAVSLSPSCRAGGRDGDDASKLAE